MCFYLWSFRRLMKMASSAAYIGETRILFKARLEGHEKDVENAPKYQYTKYAPKYQHTKYAPKYQYTKYAPKYQYTKYATKNQCTKCGKKWSQYHVRPHRPHNHRQPSNRLGRSKSGRQGVPQKEKTPTRSDMDMEDGGSGQPRRWELRTSTSTMTSSYQDGILVSSGEGIVRWRKVCM